MDTQDHLNEDFEESQPSKNQSEDRENQFESSDSELEESGFFLGEKPEEVFASYGADKETLYADSHLVYVAIQIGGVDYFKETHIELTLQQKLGEHHYFELICDPDEFDEDRNYPFRNSRKHLGSSSLFSFGSSARPRLFSPESLPKCPLGCTRA
jgi:hypothetical protein